MSSIFFEIMEQSQPNVLDQFLTLLTNQLQARAQLTMAKSEESVKSETLLATKPKKRAYLKKVETIGSQIPTNQIALQVKLCERRINQMENLAKQAPTHLINNIPEHLKIRFGDKIRQLENRFAAAKTLLSDGAILNDGLLLSTAGSAEPISDISVANQSNSITPVLLESEQPLSSVTEHVLPPELSGVSVDTPAASSTSENLSKSETTPPINSDRGIQSRGRADLPNHKRTSLFDSEPTIPAVANSMDTSENIVSLSTSSAQNFLSKSFNQNALTSNSQSMGGIIPPLAPVADAPPISAQPPEFPTTTSFETLKQRPAQFNSLPASRPDDRPTTTVGQPSWEYAFKANNTGTLTAQNHVIWGDRDKFVTDSVKRRPPPPEYSPIFHVDKSVFDQTKEGTRAKINQFTSLLRVWNDD